jgi:diguanylate cyclase (GGDEF)-like protein/PAS domain S-box-containing protein
VTVDAGVEQFTYRRFVTSSAARIWLVAALYLVAAEIAFLLNIQPGNITPIFPAAGIALVTVYLFGRPASIGVWIGAVVGNTLSFFDFSHPSALGTLKSLLVGSCVGLGAMAGANLGAYLLRRFCGKKSPLESGRNLFVLIAGAGIFSCLVSPTVGVLSLSLGGFIPWKLFTYSWLTWWMGDAIGVLIFAPFLLAWWRKRALHLPFPRLLEALTLALGLSFLLYLVFILEVRVIYIVLIFLLWSAFRFGMRGVTTVSVFIAITATIGTSLGHGLFVSGSVNESLLRLYLVLSISVVCGLLPAGVLAEYQRTQQALAESEEIFRAITEASPLAIVLYTAQRNVYINPAFSRLFGYTAEDIPTVNHWYPLAYPELEYRQQLVEEWERRVARAMATNSAIEPMDAEVTAKDGSKKTISWGFICIGKWNLAFGLDLTERKKGEERLRQSEAAYRATFYQAAIGIIHVSFDGVYLRCNSRFAEIVGYPIEEIPGMRVEQVTSVEDLPQTRQVLQSISGGETASVEWEKRYLRKDGRLIWVRLVTSVERDSEGHPLHQITFVEDIQARKDAEKRLAEATAALRASDERYRTAFKTSLDTICLTRLDDGMIIDVNDTFFDVLGYSRSELVEQTVEVPNSWIDADGAMHDDTFLDLAGRTTLELAMWVDPGERQRWAETLRREGVCRNFETRLRRKNGQVFWALLSASVTVLEAVPCALKVIRDISEVKAAEERLAAAAEALRTSEERYRTAFQTSFDTLGITRLQDGVYIDVNEAYVRTYGYKREELIGHTPLEFGMWVNPEERRLWVEAIQRDSACLNLEAQLRRKDGKILWVMISASLIELDGVACIYHVSRDITEDKLAAERLAAAAEALRASEVRYRTAFQTSLDAISISRLEDGMYIDINAAHIRIFGRERDEVVGHTSSELDIWMDPEDRSRYLDILQRDSVCRSMETRIRKHDGNVIWVRISGSIFELDGVPCLHTISRDITEEKLATERLAAAAEALRTSEERYRTAFQTTPDAVMITGLDDGLVIDVNQGFVNMIGYQREEIIGKNLIRIKHWVEPEEREKLIGTLRRERSFRDFETRFYTKSGEIVWGLISASVIDLNGVPCLLSVTRDVTAAKAAEKKIQSLSFYDTLTNLPNRRLLMERLRKARAACGQSNHKKALLHIDLDHFKTLNDTLGHPIGDLLLQEVARRIRGCVRDADTVARLGGDEFAVILEDLSEVAEDAAAQAGAVGAEILTAVNQTYTLSLLDCRCTASIGVTIFCDQDVREDEILQQADIAIGQAKAAGRNAVRFFSRTLQAAVNARAGLEEDLRQAIEADQFLLYYQPQVDNSRLIGAEALIRWKHPLRGMVSPSVFIPLAEEMGLILPLGDWVIEQACRQIALWTSRNLMADLTIAVNVSARQFHQSDFVETVLSVLERTGADPQYLELELTESSLVENVEGVIAKMTQLKAYGLRFSLDDFGTGYSSLSYLKRLPLNQLKIDISFVRDILEDAGSGVIAETIIALGRAMGLEVIAEGVETEAQRAFLADLGCTNYQGYLFSRPLPVEEFERWLSCPSLFPK